MQLENYLYVETYNSPSRQQRDKVICKKIILAKSVENRWEDDMYMCSGLFNSSINDFPFSHVYLTDAIHNNHLLITVLIEDSFYEIICDELKPGENGKIHYGSGPILWTCIINPVITDPLLHNVLPHNEIFNKSITAIHKYYPLSAIHVKPYSYPVFSSAQEPLLLITNLLLNKNHQGTRYCDPLEALSNSRIFSIEVLRDKDIIMNPLNADEEKEVELSFHDEKYHFNDLYVYTDLVEKKILITNKASYEYSTRNFDVSESLTIRCELLFPTIHKMNAYLNTILNIVSKNSIDIDTYDVDTYDIFYDGSCSPIEVIDVPENHEYKFEERKNPLYQHLLLFENIGVKINPFLISSRKYKFVKKYKLSLGGYFYTYSEWEKLLGVEFKCSREESSQWNW